MEWSPALSKVETSNPALTQNDYTQIVEPGFKRMLEIQNPGDDEVKLYFADNPFCLSLDGGDHVVVDGLLANAGLLAATCGSIRARIYLDAVGVTNRTILSLSDASANEYLRFYVTTAGKVAASLRTAAGEQWTLSVDTALEAGTWYTVKLNHNGTIPTIYIDNSKWAQTLSGSAQDAWVADLSNLDKARIGSLNTNGAGEAQQFVGDIDYVYLFNDNGVDQDAVALYRLTEGTATTAGDTSGNSYDGSFGAGAAAPAWAVNTGYLTLPDTGWNGRAYDISLPTCGIWAYTTGAGVTLNVLVGY